jgi:hypothetical protein
VNFYAELENYNPDREHRAVGLLGVFYKHSTPPFNIQTHEISLKIAIQRFKAKLRYSAGSVNYAIMVHQFVCADAPINRIAD